ncbi:MAG: c-type cytochrome [Lysobacterales bacterium]
MTKLYSFLSPTFGVFLSVLVIVGCDRNSSTDSNETVSEQPLAPQASVNAAPVAGSPEAHYQQYCALCHGKDREGYANDNAPSLRSKTLFSAGLGAPYMAALYGRPGTPMGPYVDELGGPMTRSEIGNLTAWMSMQVGVQPSRDDLTPINGDVGTGRALYAANCAQCHGPNGEGGGEGIPGTALGNTTMLATSPDTFLRLAIAEGRDGTAMRGFSGEFDDTQIDALVAFLRSRAQGWDAADLSYNEPPKLDNLVLNADGEAPQFSLKDGRYVMAEDLNAALEQGRKMVLIDTRVPYFWAMAHIAGSTPMPYYSDNSEFIEAIPNDDTWIVAYCECPRAAADSTVNKLRELGYQNTAVLWEGYAGWSALGYPVAVGKLLTNETAGD